MYLICHLAYSPDHLQYLIDQGCDVTLPLLEDDIESYDISDGNDRNKPSPEKLIAFTSITSDEDHSARVAYPLHVAIVCLYHAAIKSKESGQYKQTQAMKIIEILLENGSEQWGCGNVLTLNVENYRWLLFHEDYPYNLPVHLAIFLKKHTNDTNGSHAVIDEGIRLLQNASKQSQCPKFHTTPVLSGVPSCYMKMLFSDDYSDVSFHCSDGVCIPAHKCILAASSAYFKTALRGDWAENNADGIWETSHSSSIIKSVLTVIYTGSVEQCESIMDAKDTTNALDLLDVACEYDIKHRVEFSVDNCIRKLEVDNVSTVLQYANSHTNVPRRLKMACFLFVKKNTGPALMDPDMMKIAMEDPELWGELGIYLNAKSEKRLDKRARTD